MHSKIRYYLPALKKRMYRSSPCSLASAGVHGTNFMHVLYSHLLIADNIRPISFRSELRRNNEAKNFISDWYLKIIERK